MVGCLLIRVSIICEALGEERGLLALGELPAISLPPGGVVAIGLVGTTAGDEAGEDFVTYVIFFLHNYYSLGLLFEGLLLRGTVSGVLTVLLFNEGSFSVFFVAALYEVLRIEWCLFVFYNMSKVVFSAQQRLRRGGLAVREGIGPVVGIEFGIVAVLARGGKDPSALSHSLI